LNIKVFRTKFEGVLIIQPDFFQDRRGFFFESYKKTAFAEHGLDHTFVQDNHSRSGSNVIRGFHYQDMISPQYRLVRCTVGEVWDVVIDLRVGSPTFGQWLGVSLSAENKKQLLMAPEFAHGFAVMSDVAEVQYKCTNYHNPSAEKGFAWDDPDVNVPWPIKDPILSDRDRHNGITLKEYLKQPAFVYEVNDLSGKKVGEK
jgi:dTDP-4-dehydrorhamnose 3,5-epimerase